MSVKTANFHEETGRNQESLPSEGGRQVRQSTVLFKNVVPVEGTASCVFVKRKRDGLTAFADNRSSPKRLRSCFLYQQIITLIYLIR